MLHNAIDSNHESCPNITGEYLANLIRDYHDKKKLETSKWYRITHPVSEWMRALENYYHTVLRQKKAALSHEECFDLAKIAFLDKHKLGTKSREIKQALLLHYDNLSIIAALIAAGDPVDELRCYFKAMCIAPNHAANISYTVLLLNTFIKEAKSFGIMNPPNACKLQKKILENPAMASHCYSAVQQLQKHGFALLPAKNQDEIIRKDRLVFITTMLVSANICSTDLLQKIQTASIQQLLDIANQIDRNNKEAYPTIIQRISSPKLSQRLFEAITTGEEVKSLSVRDIGYKLPLSTT